MSTPQPEGTHEAHAAPSSGQAANVHPQPTGAQAAATTRTTSTLTTTSRTSTTAPAETTGSGTNPSTPAARHPSASLVMRAVEKTADKLSRHSLSKSTTSASSSSASASGGAPASGQKRLFSRPRRKSRREADATPDYVTPIVASTPDLVHRRDESPFIRPSSPAPSFQERDTDRDVGLPVGDYASFRMGTQTLIQALQAVPWDDDADDIDDALPHIASASVPPPAPGAESSHGSDDDSDGEDGGQSTNRLASSIHTIHRPVARSKRRIPSALHLDLSSGLADHQEEEGEEESPSLSSDEADRSGEQSAFEDGGDFEPDRRELGGGEGRNVRAEEEARKRGTRDAIALVAEGKGAEREAAANAALRSGEGGMATVRKKKRALLAEKLRDVFELAEIREVIAEMPCWLLRSILLQGYMYLTNSHLCFFAHMPSREDQVLKSGPISKKTQRTRRWIKHWFVLKNDALSWYQSSADPYFPHGVVDLRYAISCEATGERDLRIRTNQKTILLSADSVPSRDEWVKAIKRVMFKAQHSGENVKIGIPYSAILDVSRSHAMDFSETLEVKVIDADNHLVSDSYFFAYFPDLGAALSQISDAVRSARATSGGAAPPAAVMDTTQASPVKGAGAQPAVSPRGGATLGLGPVESPSKAGFRLSSLWRGSTTAPATPVPKAEDTLAMPPQPASADDFTHIQKRGFGSFVPLTLSPKHTSNDLPPTAPLPSQQPGGGSGKDRKEGEHTYPPSPTSSEGPQHLQQQQQAHQAHSSTSSWSVGMPSWLRMPTRGATASSGSSGATRVTGPASSALSSVPTHASDTSRVSEVYTPAPHSSAGSAFGFLGGDLGYSILETPVMEPEPEALERFRSSFALGDEEKLLGYFPGWLYRLIPVPGRMYISTNYVCFRSTLTAKTRMIIPIHDILNSESSRAFHFGHYGLVLNLRGHEELFLEFSHDDRRRSFQQLLNKRQEELRRRAAEHANDDDPSAAHDKTDTVSLSRPLIFEDFEPGSSAHDEENTESGSVMTHSATDPLFTSASSTFLRFKPERSLHFTFLTIGSRGDVQPYIALAKGLMADGHRVRIATHGEFREWIEAQGIEFGYVGGDPAELMRICVENGMFTVSFLKEGLQKFRGWLDDLFKTSWEACQGTDVLVESPSAMAGYHIAEALQIPYFRAFTMTWSRTRAYPHAFAVPDHKMGGSYNYMTYVMFDQVFWRAIAGQVNRWRRRMLKLPSTNLDLMEPHKVPFLYNFSPSVVPPPLDWPDWIRITGYWFLDSAEVGAKEWTPPSDLVEFIDSAHKAGKKVVYIGFGSIVVSDPRGMTRTVVEAIERSGVYAILSKGWSDRLQNQTSAEGSEPEPPLPKQIYPIQSIPHDWLFQRIDAACHHGGAGTTGASLRAGIPTIIKPFFGDQYFWANRVEALGIGSGVRKLTVESLTEALINATTDAKQVERAKLVGEQIRAENGVANAIQALYRDMDYARSLIRRRPAEHEDQHHLAIDTEAENATIRDSQLMSSPIDSGDGDSLYDSPPPSSDWSMIEEGDSRVPRSTTSSRRTSANLGRRRSSSARPSMSKRSSLVAGVLSVLPDSLSSPTRPSGPSRSVSSPTATVTSPTRT